MIGAPDQRGPALSRRKTRCASFARFSRLESSHFVCATAASAVDGVNEINHTSVIASGGYPFVIGVGASSSYVLTGNLTPPLGTDAISVTAIGVTIDLNGFSIIGAPGGPANGVSAPGVAGLTVRNGEIRGFTGPGIEAGPDAKSFKTRITGNAGGIAVPWPA
jgi:hypothetical protein